MKVLRLPPRFPPDTLPPVVRITHCDQHVHQAINTYCGKCKEVICLECIFDLHKGHEVDKLANVLLMFKEEISASTKKVREYEDEKKNEKNDYFSSLARLTTMTCVKPC